MILETQRLVLRPVHLTDADDIFEYAKNLNVGPSAGWEPHKSKRDTLKLMHTLFLDNPELFGIIEKSTGKLIGTISFAEDPKRRFEKVRMLGYTIGEPYWGKGYVTEASKAVLHHCFLELGLDMITVYCYPENIRSKRVIEKCSFEYEGRMKKGEKIYDGTLKDVLCFSQTKDEFLAKLDK